MHFQRAKVLGIMGSILLLLLPFATIPQLGGTIILPALAVLLVALWYLTQGTGINRIFTHYRLFAILMVVVTVGSLVRTQYWDALNIPQLPPQVLSAIDALLIILPAIAAYFLMQSYRRIKTGTGVMLFGIVGIANFVLVALVALSGLYFLISPQVTQWFQATLGVLWVLLVVAIPVLTLVSFAFLPARTRK
jgi:uncharacterized membrane protein